MNKGSFVEGILGGAGGGSSSITANTTPIAGGTDTRVLFDDAGVVGENAGLTFAKATGTLTATVFSVSGAGSVGTNAIQIGSVGSGFYNSAGATVLSFGGAEVWVSGTTNFRLASGTILGWSSSTVPSGTLADSGLQRLAAGIIGATLGASGVGWLQNSAGEEALNANYTNGTAAFTNTNLSITVVSGRTYNFEINLFISQTVAADGWAIDFNGGTAAMTNFIANAASFSETGAIVALANAISAALATVINATTTGTTGGQWIKVHGSFVPSGNGTFIIRARLNTLSTGVITIKRGSNLIARDSRAV